MHFFMGHFDRHRQANQRADRHREQRYQRRVVARAEQRLLQARNMVKHQHAHYRHHRNGQRR
ncbi:hypothetical protein D3C76_1349740 [compost metagenome]